MSNSTSHCNESQCLPPDVSVGHVEDGYVSVLHRAWTLLLIVFLIIDTILVVLRYLAWYVSGLDLQIYDILILPSWMFCAAACGCILGEDTLVSTTTSQLIIDNSDGCAT